MTTRSIHAVVVAYHAAEQLDRSLAALAAEVEVTVVDNSSSADVHTVTHRHGATYLDAGGNLGFGAGANCALREIITGAPREVLLLNPDAVVEPLEIHELATYLGRPGNECVATVSPRIVDGDGSAQRVEWPFPTPSGAWVEAVGLGSHRQSDETFVIAAVMLIRWEALLEVGLFDERFFLYAEETDWQRRALALGWKSAVCTDTLAIHRGAGTSEDPRRREALFHAGQETYIRKWFGRLGWLTYRSATCVGAIARVLVLAGDRRAAARRRAVLYLRGPRRCARLARE